MKPFIFIALLLSCFGAVNAQEETNQKTDKAPKAGSFKKILEEPQKPPVSGQFSLDYNGGCGNPSAESQIYSYRYGQVLEITSDNKIIVRVVRSNNVWDDEYEKIDNETGRKLIKAQIYTVSLVGIDDRSGQTEIQKILLEKVLDREVTLIGNTIKDNHKKIDALVRLSNDDEIDEVSKYLLENGIARFKEFQLTNLVPKPTACELKRAETKAKTEKLGIWAK